jgi:hypothetical protein
MVIDYNSDLAGQADKTTDEVYCKILHFTHAINVYVYLYSPMWGDLASFAQADAA